MCQGWKLAEGRGRLLHLLYFIVLQPGRLQRAGRGGVRRPVPKDRQIIKAAAVAVCTRSMEWRGEAAAAAGRWQVAALGGGGGGDHLQRQTT